MSIAADSGSDHAVTWTLLNVVISGPAVALPADGTLHEHEHEHEHEHAHVCTYVHETNALY